MIEGVNLEIKRSQRKKTASVEVYPAGRVVVAVPIDFPDTKIKELLQRKQRWIIEKIRELSDLPPPRRAREFVSGESFPLMGKEYRLKVIRTNTAQVVLKDQRVLVSVPDGLEPQEEASLIKSELTGWYKARATERFRERVEYFGGKLHVCPSRVSVRDYDSRWGTCKPNGELIFNWRIVMAPSSVLDYVVVHELCHLEVSDHSPRFWRLVASVLPNYEKSKRWLQFMDYKNDLSL